MTRAVRRKRKKKLRVDFRGCRRALFLRERGRREYSNEDYELPVDFDAYVADIGNL